MKKKFLYLNLNSNDYSENSGVQKKISAQIESLIKLGFKVDILGRFDDISSRKYHLNYEVIQDSTYSSNILYEILSFFKIPKVKKILEIIEKEKYDYIFIRRRPLTYGMISFLKKIKNNNILWDIPTYPYDEEDKKIKNKILLFFEKVFFRNKLRLYVNKIITLTEDKEIFNIKCINIVNGIDLRKITLKKINFSKEVSILSVSTCHEWHGIDRFLYSLLQYRKNGGKEKIKFHIVGEGTEIPKLKKIVEDNIELQDIVIFYGFKAGEELDEIYNNSDIALGSLGFNRINLEKGSTLKMREYCAKGIPFVVGYNDTSFSKDLPFYYQVSNDESLLDIEKIIEWYKSLKVTPEEIRKYAEDNLTWDKQMKKVIDNI